MSARKITTLWKTMNGREIPICDMMDSHLMNAIKYIERKALKTKTEECPYLTIGQIVIMVPGYSDLLKEMRRRLGLKKSQQKLALEVGELMADRQKEIRGQKIAKAMRKKRLSIPVLTSTLKRLDRGARKIRLLD